MEYMNLLCTNIVIMVVVTLVTPPYCGQRGIADLVGLKLWTDNLMWMSTVVYM